MDARAKYDIDKATGQERLMRLQTYAILSSWGDMPPMTEWWKIEGDEDLLPDPAQQTQTMELSGKEFMELWRMSFRG